MKKGIIEKASIYIVFLIAVSQFASCSEEYNIKIVTVDDSTYMDFDSLSFFPESDIDWKNSKWQEENKQTISDLYIASDRGKKKFEYIFYINESGEYDKVGIVKSLNKNVDIQFVNFSVKSFPGKGKFGDKIVKYKKVVNNESFDFPNWKNAQKEIIPIVNEDDHSYETLAEPKYLSMDTTKAWGVKKNQDYYERVLKVPSILRKNLLNISLDLQKMKRTFVDELPIGFTNSYYMLYVNKNGKLDKVRTIEGLPSKINDLFISFLPIIKYPKYIVSGDSLKYKFILKSRILKNHKEEIDEINQMVSFDEEPIIESIAHKNKKIEVVEEIDSSFVELVELDNISETPHAFFWRGVFPIIDNETQKELDLFLETKYKIGMFPFWHESEDEFKFILLIDTDGFVEKVKVEKGHGQKLNNSVFKILEEIHFKNGIVDDEPVKYKANFKLRFTSSSKMLDFPTQYYASIINPLFRKTIHELPDQYTEKDFMVLPDVSAKPIGGYTEIAEKVKYPDLAIRYKREGEVSVKTYLNEEGKVIGVQVLKAEGYGFEEAAVDAVKRTKFEPAYQDGKPIKSIYVIPIQFILDSGEIKVRREKIDAYKAEEEPESKENNEPFESLNKDDNYFVVVEDMPLPIGGISEIQNKITYPRIARMAGVQGRVFVKAFINESGDVEQTEIIKGIGAGCDDEAMRVIKETKFTPGKQKGKAVKVQVSIPILFSLKSTDSVDSTKHFGYWVGESDKGEEIKIWFLKNGYTELYKGKAGRMDGKITAAKFGPKFKINYKTTLVELDLEYFGIGGLAEGKQLCILKFNSSNEIEIGLPIGFNKRPKNYSQTEVNEIWTLRKIKD